ncbi:MAG: NAD(P)H-binding protein [Betaproteobacteria bacterium]
MRAVPGKSGSRTAVVAGPTGLVGSRLLDILLREPRYWRVVALSRRPLAPDPKLEVVEADYDGLDECLRGVTRADRPVDVFCCLGTTIGRAGSKEAFRRVDHDYALALGRWAREADAHRTIVISALGADASSRVFYNRVKGETERDLAALGLASLVIVRPSLLSGQRDEFRLGERLALVATRPLRALIPAAVRPIAADDVARAMVDAALADAPPAVIESGAMQDAGRGR